MPEVVNGLSTVLAVLLLLVVGAAAVALVGRVTAHRGYGFFEFFPAGVLISLGLLVFVSARTFDVDVTMEPGAMLDSGNALLRSVSPVISLAVLFVSAERIVSFAFRGGRARGAPWPLFAGFVLFWLTTVASPALLGAHGEFRHEDAYTLVIGCAALLLGSVESSATVTRARDCLIAFLALGLLLVPLRPMLVLDRNYAGGLLPGLPRLAGLAPHPVGLGMLAQLAVLCLLAYPVRRRWLGLACWAVALVSMFFAQSKTTWLAFPVCAVCMLVARGTGREQTARSTGVRMLATAAAPFVGAGAIVAFGAAYMSGVLADVLAVVSPGEPGRDVTSLSGRDKIWAVALEDWSRWPVFGYGSQLFDEGYRVSVGMPFATHGHNQFVDTLARSGLVGAAGLVLYVAVLAFYSARYARASRGLSVALFAGLVLSAVSEVPLSLAGGYGPEALGQFLLLAVLGGNAMQRAESSPAGRDWSAPRRYAQRRPREAVHTADRWSMPL